jgi:hypothetical protein
MFRKFVLLMFLFTFVATASAEDLNPPSWAGAEGSWYGSWQFFPDDNPWVGDYGDWFELFFDWTDALDLTPIEDEDPYWELVFGGDDFPEVLEEGGLVFAEGVWQEGWFWSEGGEAIYGPADENKLFRIQITTTASYWWLEGYVWNTSLADMVGVEGEFVDGGLEMYTGEAIDVRDLGDGLVYFCYETAILSSAGSPEGGYFDFVPEDGGGTLKEVVIDFISYSGDNPPDGPSREGSGLVVKVSDESPEDGETGVRCDVNVVDFNLPNVAVVMDPNADPNLKGPFDFYVYGDVCEGNVVDRISLIETFEDVSTDIRLSAETGFIAPGETYYWLVDINDQNDGGDPCLYDGPLFSYVKWGYAFNPSPTDFNDTIDPGQTLTLTWEGDGYALDYDVTISDDSGVLASATVGTESWSPSVALALGAEYTWQVSECNDWMGSELCVAGPVWTFNATLCETLDNFEGYADDTALSAVWKDYSDTGGDNGCEHALETGTTYEGDQSMQVITLETFLDPIGDQPEDLVYIVPSDANLARDGGKSVWVAYRSSVSNPPSSDQGMWMGFDDGTNDDVIVYPGDNDDANGWSIFFVALSETTTADETSIDRIMLGMYGDTGGSGEVRVFFDLLTRCGSVCPYDYGYPDAVAGSFAPSYTKMLADIAGPFREFINAEGETEGPDCVVDGFDIASMFDAWLYEDFELNPSEPCAANLVVEYLFSTNLNDTSGKGNHGIAINDVNVALGYLDLANDDGNLALDYNAVKVPIDPCLFSLDGSKAVTVSYILSQEAPATTFSVSRERIPSDWMWEGDGYVYDPCAEDVNNDPNCYGNPALADANWCDTSYPTYPYEDGSYLALFTNGEEASEQQSMDRWFFGSASVELDDNQGVHVIYVATLEGEEQLWINGLPLNVFTGEVASLSGASVEGPENDSVLIGMSYSPFPSEDGIPFMTGQMDDFKVYDYALSWEEIMYLETGTTTPVPFELDTELDPNPNLDDTVQDGNDIIHFLDHAKFGAEWGDTKPFE